MSEKRMDVPEELTFQLLKFWYSQNSIYSEEIKFIDTTKRFGKCLILIPYNYRKISKT